MRLARYSADSGPRLGLVLDEALYDLADAAEVCNGFEVSPLVGPARCGDTLALLNMGQPAVELLAAVTNFVRQAAQQEARGFDRVPLSESRLLEPLANPGKILCLARNYYEGRDRETIDKALCTPRLFLKPNSALIPTGADIRVPPLATVVVPEIEMTAVIGKEGRDIPVEEAEDYLVAYTMLNDFSARKLDLEPERMGQPWDGFFDWLNGKWFDTFAVMGPWLTFKSEVPCPGDLSIRCTVDGRAWTQGTTRDMIFSPAETIAFISRITTLQPGDLIATGVPVHEKEQAPVKSGDLIEGEIEGLGALRNRVVWTPAQNG